MIRVGDNQPVGSPDNKVASVHYGFGAGKKPKMPNSQGVRGAMKERIVSRMLDAVAGDYKVLLCDKTGAEVISTCLRMHEMLEHGVTLVEDLFLERQPIISSPAIYFISAEEDSVRRMMHDWETKKPYSEAHVFFVGVASDRAISIMSEQKHFAEEVKTVQDMMLDFSAPETLLFHFGLRSEIPKLYPPEIALSGGRENILGQVANKLVSVFYTLGNGVPVIRYQGTSRLAQHVARGFYDNVAQMAKHVPDFKIGVTTPNTPILVIVDRSFDAVAPLMHERTYQCMLDDLMPLENGLYQQEFTGRDGAKNRRLFPVDEQDPYWCFYRHKFIATCLEELPKRLNELLDANPALARGLKQSAATGDTSGNLAALGGAVRALPEFQEKQAKLSMHIDICTKLMEKYKSQKLSEVCDVEQDLAASRKGFKDVFEAVRRVAGDTSVPSSVRLRLVLILIAATNTREFSEDKKQQLIRDCGLANDASLCEVINMLISRQGRVSQEPGSATDSESSRKQPATNALADLAARSLRRRPAQSAASSVASNPANAGDKYKNQAYLVLDAVVNNTLSTGDFPVLNAAMSEMRATTLGGAAASRRTLRAGLSRMQDGGEHADPEDASAAASVTGKSGVAMLDLGHEGQFSINSTQRVILFVLGGVSYGEARAAYEVSRKNFREVIVGGTSILQPDAFVSQLSSLR